MLDQPIRLLLQSVIYKHLDNSKYKVFVFGSRALPNHRKFCDVDIGIIGSSTLPASTLVEIQEDLRNSDIPYMTDVVDFNTVSADFRKKALSAILPL